MANPQPKPAQANADAHRNEDDDTDQDTAEIPGDPVGDGALGDDADGGDGGGGGGGTMGGGDGGMSIPNVNGRTLVMVGVGILAGYAFYKYVSSTSSTPRRTSGTTSAPDDSGDVDRGEGVADVEQPVVDIPQDSNDPLKADHEAGKYIFGWGDE